MKKILFVLCLSVLSAACAAKYHVNTTNPNNATSFRVSRFDNVYVARAADAAVRGEVYNGSGVETSQALVNSFQRYSNRVVLGDDVLDAKTQIQRARDQQFEFIILPKIMGWRAFSDANGAEVPAKISIKLLMVDLRNDRVIKLTTLTAVAGEKLPFGIGTKIPLDFRSPEQLLAPTFNTFSDMVVEEAF